MSSADHPLIWLHQAGQHLALVPTLGGSVAAWQLDRREERLDLFRPWNGRGDDRYTLAAFAMVPWCNRISAGGFTHAGHFYPIAPNRENEPYPIHGDGWLQPWTLTQPRDDTVVMRLASHCFNGNPHEYHATQTFTLEASGMEQTVSIAHVGREPLPYGIGIHPWFVRTARARLSAAVQGVWLTGAGPLPTTHTPQFPSTWDLREPISANGTSIDNTYTGWSGAACIEWPEHQLKLDIKVAESTHNHCHLYRPPQGATFCFEPVSHPIDAFHLPGQPGLSVLRQGESLEFKVRWLPKLWMD
jgi:aldose 1-epimerase